MRKGILLIAFLCAAPLPLEGQSHPERVALFTAAADHIRAFAPADAQIYLQPSDSGQLDELRTMSEATGIPIGARTEVLVCPHSCYAAEGTVLLVRIADIDLPRGDSAAVELELFLYQPDHRFYAQGDRVHLGRWGDSWRITRLERMFES